MKTTHTPGPWGIEKTRDTLWIGPLRKDGTKIDVIVASIETDSSYIEEAIAEREANAQAISALPDLLEACKAMLAYGSLERRPRRVLQLAEAAIKKAEGEV